MSAFSRIFLVSLQSCVNDCASPFGPVCSALVCVCISLISSDPSIVNNFSSRTLGQIRVRFTKFRCDGSTRWKTRTTNFSCAQFQVKIWLLSLLLLFLVFIFELKICRHLLFLYVFFFLFNFSGFSALHLTLSSMWALFRCSFVFISDRSLSNKTFQIVSEQHSWVLCAQHSGSSQFDSVQITQTQLIQSNKSKSQCKSQLNSRIQYVKCNERPKTTRPVECVKEELLGGSKSTAIAA